ncbi:hypothetical protein MVEN_00694500 [Mycena venus]|uniref:SSCRP protein n=1 Tax=Mycena venus TaxID=2733690 RepID=A0A8H6YEK7_9AGAR|nr:hypothetical protein MVEN_00694400 [Mycena venus]KAF7359701.1 hypothetical protein MVEN_00694500 [Mycena venus]
MRFTISLLAAVVLAIQANAQQIMAFSGNSCDGGQGGEVPCDGTCFDFTGRHSYKIFSSTADVSLFSGADCTGQEFPFGPDPAGQCINVNTGTSISTFRCTRA